MSFFARQPSVLILSVMVLGAMNAQVTQRSGFANHRLSDQYRRHKAQHDHPARTVDVLEEARRTLSNLSPAARRFLFSPTIQNTITNLNSNTNTQGIPTFGDSIESDQKSPQILGYVNPHTGVVEYDLRGHVRKITFLIG
ncbi:uncharacterized protein LOC124298339 isoform X2 [Neodiprion virginianus]|uniref:Uncharacterized protein LOC107225816 n=1 Tax=Neodiprion lecontei TaxID=441921 RepID=A0A6J0C6A7_NEOLC|nr:uncharacterized protein LOC107225816 [Neodiprion lecontei]XP_046412765.1 uncharacterized protein LOC124176031 [Neodiprion fabricii]XP_046469884.1 uncharacterized protein LOC124213078 [Neodiprion pinetum]XP_046606164.1 uncharacterized protein LOC124298339 isoform X2 [Neodiprion virginianus]